MGGFQNSRTSNDLSLFETPASGLVSYDLETRTWYNESIIGDVFTNPWKGGQLFYSDIGGSQGILIAMGGRTTDAAGNNDALLSFGMVYIYDIATKKWHQQRTEGNLPLLSRREYCAVGVHDYEAANKTYEIFMYGGDSTTSGSSLYLDDVWVLSLPSFQWYQAGHVPVRGRYGHRCTVVGQRQMAIIGGLNPDNYSLVQDIWPLGLGIFDLSEMVFKDHYDAGAAAYTSPDVVKKWYTENGPISKIVSSDVGALFTLMNNTGSNSSSTPESGGSPSPNVDTKSTNKGAIAGGVVGGLIALTLIATGIWFWLRHRKGNKRTHTVLPEKDGHTRYEVAGKQTLHETDGYPRHEADGHQRVELA